MDNIQLVPVMHKIQCFQCLSHITYVSVLSFTSLWNTEFLHPFQYGKQPLAICRKDGFFCEDNIIVIEILLL